MIPLAKLLAEAAERPWTSEYHYWPIKDANQRYVISGYYGKKKEANHQLICLAVNTIEQMTEALQEAYADRNMYDGLSEKTITLIKSTLQAVGAQEVT